MLEVVFSESVQGTMRIAKNFNIDMYLKGSHPRGGGEIPSDILRKMYEGKPLEGSSDKVVYIGFYLDVGDIAGEIDGDGRRNAFDKLWGHVPFDTIEKDEFFERQRAELNKLITHANAGESIRIWRSNAPYSACGCLFVCDVLREYDCDIKVVTLPDHRLTSENTITTYSDWNEIYPGELSSFTENQHKLEEMEKRMNSSLWKELMLENSPLRAVVNGRLISVPEDFYDHLILGSMPEEPFVMGRLIGNILGRYPLGISDGWFAGRIEKMIREKRLSIVGEMDTTHPYGKVLKKNKEAFREDQKCYC